MRLDDAKETTIHPHEYIAKQPVNMAIYTRRTLTVPCSTMIKLTPNSKIEEQVVQRVHDGAKVYRTHTSDLFWQDAETAESGLRALAHAIEQSKKPGNKNPPSASQHLTTKDKGQTQANKAQGEPKETSTLGEAACSICAQLSPKPNPTRTLECRPQGNRPKGYCWVNNKGWLKYAEGDDPNSLLGTAIEHESDFGPPHGKCRGRIVSIIKSETEAETTLYHAKYQDGDCEDLEEHEVNDRRMPKREVRKLEGSHKLGHKQLKNDKRPDSISRRTQPSTGPDAHLCDRPHPEDSRGTRRSPPTTPNSEGTRDGEQYGDLWLGSAKAGGCVHDPLPGCAKTRPAHDTPDGGKTTHWRGAS